MMPKIDETPFDKIVRLTSDLGVTAVELWPPIATELIPVVEGCTRQLADESMDVTPGQCVLRVAAMLETIAGQLEKAAHEMDKVYAVFIKSKGRS